jgi:hypothetical protein
MPTLPGWAKVRSSINRSWRPTPMDALTMLFFAVATLLTLDLVAAQLR